MAPGREAIIANSGKSIDLLHNNCILSVEEAILMSTHNIQFHNEIRKLPLICVFLI